MDLKAICPPVLTRLEFCPVQFATRASELLPGIQLAMICTRLPAAYVRSHETKNRATMILALWGRVLSGHRSRETAKTCCSTHDENSQDVL